MDREIKIDIDFLEQGGLILGFICVCVCIIAESITFSIVVASYKFIETFRLNFSILFIYFCFVGFRRNFSLPI